MVCAQPCTTQSLDTPLENPFLLHLTEGELEGLTSLLPAPTGKGPVTQVPDSEAPRLSPRESVQTMTTPPTSQPEAKALRPGTTAMTELPLHPMSPVAPAGKILPSSAC